jgi:hypothetical protein
MKRLLAAALVVAAAPAAAQTRITPSQTRLIGCFGEAFTLVEHIWRIAPAHLDFLVAQAGRQTDASRRQYLAGIIAAADAADQTSAFAIARNLDGCMSEATANTTPDPTTVVLATAVRTELDSALEDVAELMKREEAARPSLQQAVRSTPSDHALDTPLDTYLAFGERIKNELLRLRARADALIAAATPKER